MQRILILCDDRMLCETVRHSLGGLSAEIHSAGCGEMARAVRHRSFDVVIMLSLAPLLSRERAVQRLRREGLRRPALYVVAWQQAEQIVLSLLECGIDQYMTFPVNIQRLRAKVAQELNRVR